MESDLEKFAEKLNLILNGNFERIEKKIEEQQGLIDQLAGVLGEIQKNLNKSKPSNGFPRRGSAKIVQDTKSGEAVRNARRSLKNEGKETKKVIIEALSISSNPLEEKEKHERNREEKKVEEDRDHGNYTETDTAHSSGCKIEVRTDKESAEEFSPKRTEG